MEIPSDVAAYLDSIKSQSELIVIGCYGGIGIIFSLIAARIKIKGEFDVTKLKYWKFLFIPLSCFIVGVVIWGLTNALITGYYHEITFQLDDEGRPVLDARNHLKSQYDAVFRYQFLGQAAAFLLGLVTLAGWFTQSLLANINLEKRHE
jgi:hypothetical protein